MPGVSAFLRNVKTLVTSPEIVPRYVRWISAIQMGRRPELNLSGARIKGFPNFSSYLGAIKYQPSPAEIKFLRPIAQRAKVILDVGANFGVFSILFSQWSPAADIYSFEPSLATRETLEGNLRINGVSNVRVVAAAVGEQDGETYFTVGSDPATNKIDSSGASGHAVELCSLDSFCLKNNIEHIDVLKIDVEGGELQALEGARRLFRERRVKQGIIEICPGNLRQFNASVGELVAFFRKNGYALDLIADDFSPKDSASIDDSIVLANASFSRIDP